LHPPAAPDRAVILMVENAGIVPRQLTAAPGAGKFRCVKWSTPDIQSAHGKNLCGARL
jgi:hypothetical protein